MKAIRVTQELKDLNPAFFENMVVGQIYEVNPPNVFIRADGEALGYKYNEAMQTEDGFKNIIIPNYDSNTEKLGELIEVDNEFTYDVLSLTEEELDARIPREIKTLDFQLALLNFGITDNDVMQTIDLAYSNNLITEMQKEGLILKWNKSSVIERSNEDLFNLIPLLNQVKGSEIITQEDILGIFKNYG